MKINIKKMDTKNGYTFSRGSVIIGGKEYDGVDFSFSTNNDKNYIITIRYNKPYDYQLNQFIVDRETFKEIFEHMENVYDTKTEKPKKPPIGLMPKAYYKRIREAEILDAINRYIEADMKIPLEWIEEYNELQENKN